MFVIYDTQKTKNHGIMGSTELGAGKHLMREYTPVH